MIVHNKCKWVICTPTKTGTYSLEATLIDRLNVAYKHQPIISVVGYRHMTEYDGPGNRILVIRHPLERWASIYWFTRMHMLRGNGIYLSNFAWDVNVYAKEWYRRRLHNPHPMYTDNLFETYKNFRPNVIFKQEEGLQKLIDYLGYDTRVSHKNRTDDKKDWCDTLPLLNAENISNIMTWAKPDLKKFNYSNKIKHV